MREDDIVRIAHRAIDESPRVHQIESDVSTLKSDVSTLKSDVSTLKSDVSTLKRGVQVLEIESHRKGCIMEAMQTDIRKVIEVVMHINQKVDDALGFREVVERHTDRLDAVESTLKRHIRDRRAHRSVETRK